MGKQINYWMDYEAFVLVAQKAIDLGCTIIKEDRTTGKVMKSNDISIVAPEERRYYFHLPEAGEVRIEMGKGGSEYIDRGYTASGNALIEAGYSYIINEPKRKCITRARLFCMSGYYDGDGEYVPRPDCLTKVFHSLVRFVKKIAPYTEMTDIVVRMCGEDCGEEYEYTHKEYITQTCLELKVNEGYNILL